MAKTREPLLLKELVTMETAVPISSLGMLDDMFVEVGKGIVSCECEAVLLNFLRKVGGRKKEGYLGGTGIVPLQRKLRHPQIHLYAWDEHKDSQWPAALPYPFRTEQEKVDQSFRVGDVMAAVPVLNMLHMPSMHSSKQSDVVHVLCPAPG